MKAPVSMTIAAAGLAITGCATSPYSSSHNNAANRAVLGAAAGAAVGALGGSALGGGAFEGAVTGAVAGGALGAVMKPPTGERRVYYRDTRGYCYYVDRQGRPVYDYEVRC